MNWGTAMTAGRRGGRDPRDRALVGALVDQRYRVIEHLADGGMGSVYLAQDQRLDRPVALKVMRPELARHPDFVTGFSSEARAAARLSHPNIVAVYDQGREGDRIYLAMEYVAGRTLRDVLTASGRLTPRQVVDIMRPVLSALAAAHRVGMAHGDIKPENVLIADDGVYPSTIKVADFGLARTVESTSPLTLEGALVGTASYLAPEQIRHGTGDLRSDVYAAGVMTYELLTGVKPFLGDDLFDVARRRLREDVPMPSWRVPGIDPAFDALVAHATRRDPADRPRDAGALLAELERTVAAPNRTIAYDATLRRTPAPGDTLVDTVEASRQSLRATARRPTPSRATHGLVWFTVIMVLAALVTGAGWWIGHNGLMLG